MPQLDNNCQDVEKIRIHSFDVAPNGRSLYVSMARTPLGGSGRDEHLGIYRYDFKTFTLTKISKDDGTHFMYPTYIGNDPVTKEEMLVVSKTVSADEIPINYAYREPLRDEYDRAPTPLIHTMSAVTGALKRIGFNNSHQTEPFVMVGPDENRIVVFTQWEHQASINRFALWKMQIDGSDEFTFYGDESASDDSDQNLFQGRVVRSGPFRNYILMGQGNRTDKSFTAEGDIVMTFRHHQELRSDKILLQGMKRQGRTDTNIARSPEHYNDESFIYSYRDDSSYTYRLYIKDFPPEPGQPVPEGEGVQFAPAEGAFDNNYHYVQARTFYPPERELIAPTDAADLGENRVSFTNNTLNNKAGFLVQNLTQSDNGVQHQLDGVSPGDISMQFFIPSHHFNNSKTVSIGNSPEMSIPIDKLIHPESDGSMGVILNEGLYVWKVNKKFDYNGEDIWLPVRSELQEVSFVPNRVNACNQCHQERDQANLDKYANYGSIAAHKMRGDLSDPAAVGIVDLTGYDAKIPDFHTDIMPLLTNPSSTGGKSCAACHTAGSKLDLSNTTGPTAMNSTYRTLLLGAHELESGKLLPYSNNAINPLGVDNDYDAAPLLWSLLLNNDLTVESDDDHPNDSSRTLERPGDYGATYYKEVDQLIKDINSQYDHSQHWSADDMQTFITYSSTQMPAGLDGVNTKVNFSAPSKIGEYRNNAAGQKAYQAMIRNCFSCHNDLGANDGGGISVQDKGKPLFKRFNDNTYLSDKQTRFVIRSHLDNAMDTAFSETWWRRLNHAMYETLDSATYHINFAEPEKSNLLLYALGLDAEGNVLEEGSPHYVRHGQILNPGDDDYKAINNWLTDNWEGIENQVPVLDENSLVGIEIKEYDDPAFLDRDITWSDDDPNDLSQIYIDQSRSDLSMLGLEYISETSAKLKTYAILGDRNERDEQGNLVDREFSFGLTDGQTAKDPQKVKVKVTSDYVVPEPVSAMPDNAYAFFTVRDTDTLQPGYAAGQLRKVAVDPNNPNGFQDTLVGVIDGYNNNWTTMYRRSDKGWLYFMEQKTQQIHVVDETNAQVLFHIQLDHEPNRRGPVHKQTSYLLWWRPADGLNYRNTSNAGFNCANGEIQGLLESKLSDENWRNGDWYVSLGCGEDPDTTLSGSLAETIIVTPKWRQKLNDGGDTLSVYVWKRATFMAKMVQDGVDRLNVLNLETGKPKSLGNFSFEDKMLDSGTAYHAADYFNVRAVVVSEGGAFYGFNQDANNQPVTMFNFDPIERVQVPVNMPQWVQAYFDQYIEYGTPFLVIEGSP